MHAIYYHVLLLQFLIISMPIFLQQCTLTPKTYSFMLGIIVGAKVSLIITTMPLLFSLHYYHYEYASPFQPGHLQALPVQPARLRQGGTDAG